MTRKFESTNEIELKNKIAEMNKELKLLKEEYQGQSKHKNFLKMQSTRRDLTIQKLSSL